MARKLTNRERKIGKMHGRVVKISDRLVKRYKRGMMKLLKKSENKQEHFSLGDLTKALKVKEHGRNLELITLFRAIDQLQAENVLLEYEHPKDPGMHAYRLKENPDEKIPYDEKPQ